MSTRKVAAITATLALALLSVGVTATAADARGRHYTPHTYSHSQSVSTVYWQMPTPRGGWKSKPTNATATWSQTYSSSGASKCGVWYQWDTYPSRYVAGLIADGRLTRGEDSRVVISYGFTYGGDCIPPKPAPIVTHSSHSSTDCGTGIVTTVTSTTTTNWTLRNNVWVKLPAATVDKTSTRKATTTECPPAVVVPPTQPPTHTTPPVVRPTAHQAVTPPVERTDVLARTGSTIPWLFYSGIAGFLILAGFGLTLIGRKS